MSTTSLKVTEGETDFIVPAAEKPCKTWYKVIGDLHGPTSRRPLVALHGGPGVNHGYLLILSDLTKAHSIPLIVYDQIGNGNSTHLPEKMGDISFWTEQLFLDELANLLTHLGVKEYDILGHSWGGMFGSRHAATQPAGLKHLVLASTPASMGLWVKSQNALRAKLPQDVQDILDEHEKNGTTESEAYQAAVAVFYSRHLCTINPMPEPVAEGFGWIKKDPTVYLTMNGPTEFYITGPLKEWTMIQDAHKITVPTLLVNGRHDQAQDPVVAPFFHEIPHVKWANFAESSHMVHFEERKRYMEVVGNFLVDNKMEL
ncbi:Alpha/Beta hydrolase protein [Mycena alexandri]|uniref:Alpha/Beta hydrolase protein n=1 Tax=Mycena alexandri TaxID=1745969 RepID=A0AAD6X364_9AGAR|nr:Alpha/Beta hydrolase protein [Mycena alexandri]KAJ7037259.1 Alpha/Beta hydrolase protein [Mycena alexandri]